LIPAERDTVSRSREGVNPPFFTIPAGLEGFFEELGAGLAAGKTSEAIRRELAGKYDSIPTAH
jgi:hypothetical protein